MDKGHRLFLYYFISIALSILQLFCITNHRDAISLYVLSAVLNHIKFVKPKHSKNTIQLPFISKIKKLGNFEIYEYR